MEIVGEKYRAKLVTIIMVAWSIGLMMQPCIAYLLTDEFWFQTAVLAPNIIFPLLIVYVRCHLVEFTEPFKLLFRAFLCETLAA